MTNVPGPVPAPACEHGRIDFENCGECRKRRAVRGRAMTDKTREDFERWAVGQGIIHGRRDSTGISAHLEIVAWLAYQQGIADARKSSTETAAELLAVCKKIEACVTAYEKGQDYPFAMEDWAEELRAAILKATNQETGR